MEITLINTDQIAPNKYNPNVVSEGVLTKLRAEIAQKGLCEPIIVRRRGEGYEIVDGEHRWRICRDLGLKEIPCIIRDYNDSEAKIKTLQLNYMRGSVIPVRLAHLIHDLNKEIKLEDLAKRLPYDEPVLMDHLELLKLPDDFESLVENQALLEEEELPRVVSFVLKKDQAEVLEEAIEIATKTLPDAPKNARALALERICSYFIEHTRVSAEGEAVEEPKQE